MNRQRDRRGGGLNYFERERRGREGERWYYYYQFTL